MIFSAFQLVHLFIFYLLIQINILTFSELVVVHFGILLFVIGETTLMLVCYSFQDHISQKGNLLFD